MESEDVKSNSQQNFRKDYKKEVLWVLKKE